MRYAHACVTSVDFMIGPRSWGRKKIILAHVRL